MIKLKQLLKEELLGDFDGIEVYKNPKSISRMAKELRGMSDPQGNLYVVDDAWKIIHSKLELWLKKKGYIKDVMDNWLSPHWPDAMEKMIKKGYIYWQRKGSTDNFYLGESIYPKVDWFIDKNLMSFLKKSVKNVRQKNLQYKFVLRRIF